MFGKRKEYIDRKSVFVNMFLNKMDETEKMSTLEFGNHMYRTGVREGITVFGLAIAAGVMFVIATDMIEIKERKKPEKEEE